LKKKILLGNTRPCIWKYTFRWAAIKIIFDDMRVKNAADSQRESLHYKIPVCLKDAPGFCSGGSSEGG